MPDDPYPDATEARLRAALAEALEALERIRESDPGPAYYIAKAALESAKRTLSGEVPDA